MTIPAPTSSATAMSVDNCEDDRLAGTGHGRRWPLQSLLELARLTATGLASELGIAGAHITHAARHGLSDVQADRWAIRVGYHPVLVWGWDWVEAATATANPRTLIADDLRRRIDDGELRPGDPLPPVADLAGHWRVATRTVTDATDELRREGLVTDPGRGRRPAVIGPTEREPRACDKCDQPIEQGAEHYPHHPGCGRAAIGWCDCDRPTHAGCCPSCQGNRP